MQSNGPEYTTTWGYQNALVITCLLKDWRGISMIYGWCPDSREMYE